MRSFYLDLANHGRCGVGRGRDGEPSQQGGGGLHQLSVYVKYASERRSSIWLRQDGMRLSILAITLASCSARAAAARGRPAAAARAGAPISTLGAETPWRLCHVCNVRIKKPFIRTETTKSGRRPPAGDAAASPLGRHTRTRTTKRGRTRVPVAPRSARRRGRRSRPGRR